MSRLFDEFLLKNFLLPFDFDTNPFVDHFDRNVWPIFVFLCFCLWFRKRRRKIKTKIEKMFFSSSSRRNRTYGNENNDEKFLHFVFQITKNDVTSTRFYSRKISMKENEVKVHRPFLHLRIKMTKASPNRIFNEMFFRFNGHI